MKVNWVSAFHYYPMLIYFSILKFRYAKIKLTDRMIDHMDIESTCVHKDSEEAQLQLQMDSSATGKN